MPNPQLSEGITKHWRNTATGRTAVVDCADLPAIEARARKEERERVKEVLRVELEKRRFCNKCGYFGPLEVHERETGCRYLAAADLSLLAALDSDSEGESDG